MEQLHNEVGAIVILGECDGRKISGLADGEHLETDELALIG